MSDILEKIFALKEEIKKKTEEMESLQGRLRVQNEQLEPLGFNYKEAVFSVFSERPDSDLSIDDVVGSIYATHQFSPNRMRVTNRMNYLTDKDKKLERVPGKRGFYHLKK